MSTLPLSQFAIIPPTKRHLLNFLTALSAILFVAIVVFWVRSYHVADSLSWYGVSETDNVATRRIRTLHTGLGAFAFSWTTNTIPGRSPGEAPRSLYLRDGRRGFYWEPTFPPLRPAALPQDDAWRFGPVEYFRRAPPSRPGRTRTTGAALTVSCWIPALLATALPATWLALRHRAAVRRRLGRCATCGYDLRSSPGRCPECGGDASVTPAA